MKLWILTISKAVKSFFVVFLPVISNREDVPPPESRPVSRHTSRSTSRHPQVSYCQVGESEVNSFSDSSTHTPSRDSHGHTPVKHASVKYDSQYGYAVWSSKRELGCGAFGSHWNALKRSLNAVQLALRRKICNEKINIVLTNKCRKSSLFCNSAHLCCKFQLLTWKKLTCGQFLIDVLHFETQKTCSRVTVPLHSISWMVHSGVPVLCLHWFTGCTSHPVWHLHVLSLQ